MRKDIFRMRVGFIGIIILCMLLTALACKSDNRSKTFDKSASSGAGQTLLIPAKKSALDGWQGIRVKKCGPACCELMFPENFGLNNKQQLSALKDLVSKYIEHDVDCMMQVAYDALKQMRFLAAEKQDRDAAMMLLSPSRYGGFNLDGELAEEYAGGYQLTVLEKYRDLGSVLDKNISDDVSTSVCSWAEVLGEEAGSKRLKKLVPVLKSKNLNELAQMLSEKCKAVL